MTLGDLAKILSEPGRAEKAEPLLRRALEASARSIGREHRGAPVTLGNLAKTLSERGRAEEAEPLPRRALGVASAQSAPGALARW